MPSVLPVEVAPSIGELVASRAALTPQASALRAPGRPPLSYAGLVEQRAHVTDRLAEIGVQRGDAVAVVLENGPELAAAFLGVSSAAACAPLNPAYREAEFSFALADLDARALIVERSSAPAARAAAGELGIPVVEVSRRLDGGAGMFELELRSAVSASPRRRSLAPEVALLLHTSGTTAHPKLVPLTHTNLSLAARNLAQVLRLSSEDRCLNVMPLFHIHGLVASILASLHVGGSVVCTSGFASRVFFDWLEDGPTWYTAVPTMHQAVVSRAVEGRRMGKTSLRFVRSCSAALPLAVLEGLEELFGCPAIEAYGMTEAALPITCNPLPPTRRKPGSVGLPVGVELAVLGEAGERNLLGEIGEVAVRGPTIFRGYVDNQEANRAAFTDGWFRTGDLGSLDDEGYLYLHGRSKEMINRGGEKISPREVDDVLLRHPGVADAATFALPHSELGEEVAAAVVARAGRPTTQQDLQKFAAASLADFKVPRVITFVAELPRGPTGKVQRIGLAERLGEVAEAPTPVGAGPVTALEGELCALVADALELEHVDAGDDLFTLGLDSLSAAALVSLIGDRGLGPPDLPAATLLWAPTVRALARVLAGEEHHSSTPGPLLPLGPAGTRESLFFVAPHDGTVMRFARLARSLRSGHSLVGVGAEPGAAGSIGFRSVEEIGHAYAAAIHEAQPCGPYFLGGYCMGGGIALEVARALREMREEIAVLLVVDPIGEQHGLLRASWRRAASLRRRGELLAGARRFARDRSRRVVSLGFRIARGRSTTYSDATIARFRGEMDRLSRRYAARPYDGRIVVLASPSYRTSRSFWEGAAAGGATFHRLPRYAGFMLRSAQVEDLARIIDEALATASAASE
jgi:acyl-CoA synthetase (AMP-forming)/AMP-acid ligase II/thioesterase domain-containing protein